MVCYVKDLRLNWNVVFYAINFKNRRSKIDGVVMAVYSGWDTFLLKYDAEVSLERRSIFCIINIGLL